MLETPPSGRKIRWSFAIVVVAALALHARTIGFGFSYLDDDALIVDQQEQLLSQPLARAFTRPYFPSSGRIMPTTARWSRRRTRSMPPGAPPARTAIT